MAELTVERYSGAALQQYIPAIAALRIEVFRAFPYLYEGTEAYEAEYLQTYVESPGAVVVIARDGDQVVGASTGLPLAAECAEFRQPFEQAGYAVENIFYCAESVLLPAYRGKGVGVAFFEQRIAHARATGDFDWLTFCAVQRPDDHPLRPVDYQPLDSFWQKRGFTPAQGLTTEFSWQDVDQPGETSKPMQFWMQAMPVGDI